MRYDGHGASYDQMQRDRLERLAESRKAETNEREKKEDAKNLERTRKREEKKEKKMVEEIKEEPVVYAEGGVLPTREAIRAEAFDDIRKALKVLDEFPELVRLVVNRDDR